MHTIASGHNGQEQVKHPMAALRSKKALHVLEHEGHGTMLGHDLGECRN
jgi:hypothetical protein